MTDKKQLAVLDVIEAKLNGVLSHARAIHERAEEIAAKSGRYGFLSINSAEVIVCAQEAADAIISLRIDAHKGEWGFVAPVGPIPEGTPGTVAAFRCRIIPEERPDDNETLGMWVARFNSGVVGKLCVHGCKDYQCETCILNCATHKDLRLFADYARINGEKPKRSDGVENWEESNND